MDNEEDLLSDYAGGQTIWLLVLVAFLSLCSIMISFAGAAQIGPDTGEIIVFNPAMGKRAWSQPPVQAVNIVTGRSCGLHPSAMTANGGSFVIEAKEMSLPPVYQIHWSGGHTDYGSADCGLSADLRLPLASLRALATVAGGYGVGHSWGLF